MFIDNSGNRENITLPKTVRTLPNTVRFQNQGNALFSDQIYQGTTKKNINILDIEFWEDYEGYLKKSYRESSIRCRLLYAKQYHYVITEENARNILGLPHNKKV